MVNRWTVSSGKTRVRLIRKHAAAVWRARTLPRVSSGARLHWKRCWRQWRLWAGLLLVVRPIGGLQACTDSNEVTPPRLQPRELCRRQVLVQQLVRDVQQLCHDLLEVGCTALATMPTQIEFKHCSRNTVTCC